MFLKLLETVSKGLFRNRSQNRCHTFLDCCHMCKTCAFHDALQPGKQKFTGARSGEYGGWSRTGTLHWAKNWCTWVTQCAGALSCSNIHCPVLCNSGWTRWMHYSNCFKTSSQNAEFMFWPAGMNSLWMMPSLSKKAITIVLNLDFCGQLFLGHGEDCECHFIDCRLDSRSNW